MFTKEKVETLANQLIDIDKEKLEVKKEISGLDNLIADIENQISSLKSKRRMQSEC